MTDHRFALDLELAEQLRSEAATATDPDLSGDAAGPLQQLVLETSKRLEAAAPLPASSTIYFIDDVRLRSSAAQLVAAFETHDESEVADACLSIAEWAEACGAVHAMRWFLRAAAAFRPADAAIAVRIGRLARRQADHSSARAWYNRAIHVGSATGAWYQVATAMIGLGLTEWRAGSPEDAEIAFFRAATAARKHGLTEREAAAYHNIAVLCFESGKIHDGVSYARKALDGYGRDRKKILVLANDLAWVWMDVNRAYRSALPIFEETLRAHPPGTERVVFLANAARAAAGLGKTDTYLHYQNVLLDETEKSTAVDGHAAALLELAKGALHLGLRREARRSAARALRIAQERNETALISEGEAVLRGLRVRIDSPESAVENTSSPWVEERMDDLVRQLVLTIR